MQNESPKTALDWFNIRDALFKKIGQLIAQGAPKTDIEAVSDEAWGISGVAKRTQALEDLSNPDSKIRAEAQKKIDMYKGWDEQDGRRKPNSKEEKAVLVDNHGKVIQP